MLRCLGNWLKQYYVNVITFSMLINLSFAFRKKSITILNGNDEISIKHYIKCDACMIVM